MALERVELAAQELLVVFGNLPFTCDAEQLVAVVHLDAEGLQRADYLVGIGDDSFFLVRQLGQIMLLQQAVEIQLDLLGVYHHKLQLTRMLCEEQRSDDGVQADRLTSTGGTCNEQVRHLGKVHEERLAGDGDAEGYGQVHLGALLNELRRIEHGLQRHDARMFVGHLDAYGVGEGEHPDTFCAK